MANRKEYEMLFALNASLNGNFQGTFSKAQQEFAKLGKEIRELGRLQSDISAYQKQQAAVEATGNKLENLQKQYDLIQREIQETNGPTAGLEREQVRLEQQISSTTAALERQNQRLETTKNKLEGAGVDISNLTGEAQRLAAQMEELSKAQEGAAGSAASFGQRTAEAFEAAQQVIISAGIADALGEVKDAYVECVKAAADFQEGMSTVEALSGATAEEMAELTAKAKEMGADTKYTARESADAFGYMALAGWNAQQQIAGIGPVLDLAAAANMDLAQASDIVTDYLTAFGLTANDAAAFTDKMAYAMSHSNTDVIQLGEAYKNVAATAKSMGYTVEETTAIIMGMANAGVKGGEAGTALNAIMTRLATDTKGCASALEEYGVYVYDAQGNMNTLSSILNGMVGVWGTLTDAEQAALAKTIAGTNQYSSLQTIMTACSEAAEQSGQSFNDYAAALQNCSGTAGNMAATMMDNLNGDLTKMNSALDAVKITLGEQFNPELRELTETGTDVLTWINNFAQENPSLVKGITVTAGAFGAAAVAITGVTAAIKLAGAASAIFAGTMGVAVGPVLAVAAAGAALIGIATALGDAARVTADESYELTAASREQYQQLQELNAEYEQAVEQFGEASYEAQQLKWRIDDLSDSYESGRQTFAEYQAAHEAVMESYRAVADARNQAGISLDTEAAGIEALIGKLSELTSSSSAAAENQDAIRAIIDHLNEALPDLNLNYNDAVSGSRDFIDNLMEVAQAEAEARQKAQEYENYVAALSQRGSLGSQKDSAAEQVRLAAEDYEAALAAYNSAKEPYMRRSAVVDSPGIRQAKADMEAAKEQLDAYQAGLDEVSAAYEENEAALAQLEDKFRDYYAAQEEAANAAPTLEGAISAVRVQIEQLAEAYNEAYAAAGESIAGQYSLWDQAADVAATSASSINAALESQIAYWENYNTNLASLGERSADIAGLSDMIATFADGSTDSVNAIAGMAAASDEDLRTMVSKWQELQTQQSETAGSLAELVTGFPGQMEQMVTAMEEGVAGMSMPDDAEESARTTIQAFIDEAETMLPVVQDAYAALGEAAAKSLGLHNMETRKYDPAYINQYASGTSDAPPGWAWVGEEGPELMRMRGGETVLPTDVSQKFAALSASSNAAYADFSEAVYSNAAYNTVRRGDYTAYASAPETVSAAVAADTVPSGGGTGAAITVEVHIHIEGNAAPETVQALEDYVRRGELQEAVEDAMANVQVDVARGAYV